MLQHGKFLRRATLRATLWALVVGSGLAAGLLGTSRGCGRDVE
jgi:hypothetical protein